MYIYFNLYTFQVSRCEDYEEDECVIDSKDLCHEYKDKKFVLIIYFYLTQHPLII